MRHFIIVGKDFKDLLNACPHHGYETWHIISFFYEILTPKMCQFVEMMCNGEILNKDLDEAFDYFDLLVENAPSWDTIDTSDRSRASTNPSGGVSTNLGKMMTLVIEWLV